MRLLVVPLLLCFSCASEHTGPSAQDVETHINAILQSVNEHGVNGPGILVNELSPHGFPFGPKTGVKAKEIRRLRTIDSRLLVDLLAVRNGSSFELRIWLEERGGFWLISGWSPQLRRLTEITIQPSTPIDVPRRFAASSLRRSPQPIRVPGTTLLEQPRPSRERHVWLKIRPRVRAVKGQCKGRSVLSARFRDLIPQIRGCHEAHFPGRSRASGRVILRFAQGVVTLEESTTTSEPFTRCVRQTVAAAAPGGRDCAYLIDFLMSSR